MRDIRILEAANHMHNRITLTDVCQELVAESLSLGSALYQACNIHKFDDRRSYLLRMIHFSELFNAFIRNRNHTHIGINGTERIVRNIRSCLGQ